MLLAARCTEPEISAIVEMGEQMVRHHSRDVNERRLAVNGMKKLEEARTETRTSLFGSSGTARHRPAAAMFKIRSATARFGIVPALYLEGPPLEIVGKNSPAKILSADRP